MLFFKSYDLSISHAKLIFKLFSQQAQCNFAPAILYRALFSCSMRTIFFFLQPMTCEHRTLNPNVSLYVIAGWHGYISLVTWTRAEMWNTLEMNVLCKHLTAGTRKQKAKEAAAAPAQYCTWSRRSGERRGAAITPYKNRRKSFKPLGKDHI